MTKGLGQRLRRLWLSPPCGRGKVVVCLRHAVKVVGNVCVDGLEKKRGEWVWWQGRPWKKAKKALPAGRRCCPSLNLPQPSDERFSRWAAFVLLTETKARKGQHSIL